METIEFMFEQVIKDSEEEKNKIKNKSDHDIYSEIMPTVDKVIIELRLDCVDEITREQTFKLIRMIRRYKPGYVVKDIINMLELGAAEYEFNFAERSEKMEPIVNYAASDIFEKWFRTYGLRKHRDANYRENSLLSTNRNECLGMTYKYLAQQREILQDQAFKNGKVGRGITINIFAKKNPGSNIAKLLKKVQEGETGSE